MRCALLQLFLIPVPPALVRSVALKSGFSVCREISRERVARATVEESGLEPRRGEVVWSHVEENGRTPSSYPLCEPPPPTRSGLGKWINRACACSGRLLRGRVSTAAPNARVSPQPRDRVVPSLRRNNSIVPKVDGEANIPYDHKENPRRFEQLGAGGGRASLVIAAAPESPEPCGPGTGAQGDDREHFEMMGGQRATDGDVFAGNGSDLAEGASAVRVDLGTVSPQARKTPSLLPGPRLRANLLSVRIHKTTLEVFSRQDGVYQDQGPDYGDELVPIPEDLINADGNSITADNLKRAIQRERNTLWQARVNNECDMRERGVCPRVMWMDVDVNAADMRNFELVRFELSEKERELQHVLQVVELQTAMVLQNFPGGVVPQDAAHYHHSIINRTGCIRQQLAEIAAKRCSGEGEEEEGGEVLSGEQVINLDTLSEYAFEYSPSRELNAILNTKLAQATCERDFCHQHFFVRYGNRGGVVGQTGEPDSPEPEPFEEENPSVEQGFMPHSTTLGHRGGSPTCVAATLVALLQPKDEARGLRASQRTSPLGKYRRL